MDLIELFYEPLLKGLSIEDLSGAGLLSSTFNPEKPQPVTVGGKRLVLPIKDVLRAGKKDDQIVFHPLSENVTRGESDIIKALRDYIQWRNQSVVVFLASEMGRIAASPTEHKKLGPKASKYLQKVTDFDEKTYNALIKLLSRVSPDPDRRILSISLRQGSKSKDDGTLRSANVHFPILEDLEKDDLEVFEMKMPSKKAKARIQQLFEIILGDAETRESFSYGSRNMEAPYLHALLTSHSRIAAHLNAVVATHAKLLGDEATAQLTTDLSWVPGLEEFAKYRSMVPPQSGNEGAIKVDDLKSTLKKDSKPGKVAAAPKPILAPPTDRVKEEPADMPWEGEDQFADSRDNDRQEQRQTPSRSREPEVKSSGVSDYLTRLRGGDDRDARRTSSTSILRNRDSRDNRGGGLSRNSGRDRFGGGGGRSSGRGRSY
jgi:hypothetical protein